MKNPAKSLKIYVESFILPLYMKFDRAHSTSHVNRVIDESLRLAQFYDVNVDMVYIIAAFHDVGMPKGREVHHLESAKILRSNATIASYFTLGEIEIMAQAIEDHRASSKSEPRSIYGCIVAEADRDITVYGVLERALSYGLDVCPYLGKEEQYARLKQHMDEKYSDNGYMKLYIPESNNAVELKKLRAVINDERQLRAWFDAAYSEKVGM